MDDSHIWNLKNILKYVDVAHEFASVLCVCVCLRVFACVCAGVNGFNTFPSRLVSE